MGSKQNDTSGNVLIALGSTAIEALNSYHKNNPLLENSKYIMVYGAKGTAFAKGVNVITLCVAASDNITRFEGDNENIAKAMVYDGAAILYGAKIGASIGVKAGTFMLGPAGGTIGGVVGSFVGGIFASELSEWQKSQIENGGDVISLLGDNITSYTDGMQVYALNMTEEELAELGISLDDNVITLDAETLQPYLDAFNAMQSAITDIQKASMQTINLNAMDTTRPYAIAENIVSPIILDLNGDGIAA